MAKILDAINLKDCTGCELCVMEVQRQLGKVGLEGSLIRIFRDTQSNGAKPVFNIEIDPRVHNLDIEKISEICPNSVFEINTIKDENK